MLEQCCVFDQKPHIRYKWVIATIEHWFSECVWTLCGFSPVLILEHFRYQEETLLWWYVMWKKIGGEGVLRTCGGMKLMGACLETDGRETALSPSAAHINFIVPSHGLLRKLQPIIGAEFPSTRPSPSFRMCCQLFSRMPIQVSAITCSMMAR